MATLSSAAAVTAATTTNMTAPSTSTIPTTDSTHQERLEEASAVCAKGRLCWTRDKDAARALMEFEHALRLLETLLGTYHSLTAKTYYWIGFIHKHNATKYALALKAFVQTARIRLVLLGPSHESTQEAMSAIRWVLQHQSQSPEAIKTYLSQLYESIRLETLGDAQLRHRAYAQAIDYYQQAQTAKEDPQHATIMGKRAFCHFKLKQPQEALFWYRKALMVFTCQTVHGSNHPDVPTTLERMTQVLKDEKIHGVGSKQMSESYATQVLVSVREQHAGVLALQEGRFQTALQHLQVALQIEEGTLGKQHKICKEAVNPLIETIRRIKEETQLEDTMTRLTEENRSLHQQISSIRLGTTKGTTNVADRKNNNNNLEDKENNITAGGTSAMTSSVINNKIPSQTQINNLQQERDKALHDKEALQKRFEKLEREHFEWQKNNEQAQQSILDLHEQVEEGRKRKEENENVSRVQDTLKAKVEKLEDSLRQRDAEIEALRLRASAMPTKDDAFEESTNALTDVKRNIERELNDTVMEKSELVSKVQEQECTISELQEKIANLQATPSGFLLHTPQGSPARHTGFDTPMSTLSEIDPTETQRTLEKQLQELQVEETTVERLKTQNGRAITTIQALSKELTKYEEKYRKLGGKYEKIKGLFRQVDAKNRVLKQKLTETDIVVSKGNNTSVPAAREIIPRVQPSPELIQSIDLSQFSFNTPLANYVVRRPYGLDSSSFFDEVSSDSYQARASIEESLSIQIVAIIAADQSRLYVTPDSVVHRRMDGSCVNLVVEPLGWVNGGEYSLDAILEEAIIFREHYCQSIRWNSNPKSYHLEQRLWKVIGTKWADKMACNYGSKVIFQHGPFDRPLLLFLVILGVLSAMLSNRSSFGWNT